MLMSFHVHLPLIIIRFIAYNAVILFSMRSAYTRRFEQLNKICDEATMDSKLEEQRPVIKFLLSESEKPCHIFQKMQKSIFKACITVQTFIAGFYSLRRTGQA